MRLGRLRHWAFYGLFRGVVGLFDLLPLPWAVRLGEVLGWKASFLAGRRRRMAAHHLRRVLGSSDPAAVRAMFAAYGRYWAEALWMRPARRPIIEATTQIDGLEHALAAKAAGQGTIFALPHVGNWEIAGPVADKIGVHLVAVAENLPNPYLRDWFVRLRAALGIEIVLTDASGGVTRRLLDVLKANGGVALLCDRDLSGRGIKVKFFGEETTLPSGPVRLALRTGATLLPVASYFAGRGHRVDIRSPVDLSLGDAVEGTQALARRLEELIAAAPTQWHLLQPNWPSDRAI